MKAKPSTCRHCASTDLYSKEVHACGAYGPDLLPLDNGFFSFPKFEIRVCTACGLVGWFVPQEHLSRVQERFDPVN